MKIIINADLACVVESNTDHCIEDRMHCHVTRGGEYVAQIYLNPVSVERSHKLNRSELALVLGIAENNHWALVRAYRETCLSGEI